MTTKPSERDLVFLSPKGELFVLSYNYKSFNEVTLMIALLAMKRSNIEYLGEL